nr:MAG TPA: HNH endonuclease [Bacteriophage sp.]
MYYGIDAVAWVTEGKIVAGTTVHHIVPYADNERKRADENNLILVSDNTHRIIHNLYSMNDDEKRRTIDELFEIRRRFLADVDVIEEIRRGYV